MKSSSLSGLVFTLTLNSILARSTSICSSRNILNVSLMTAPLKAYLKVTDQSKKPPRLPACDHPTAPGFPTTNWKGFLLFCARGVTLFLGTLCTFFPHPTFSTWNCNFFFFPPTRGSLCLPEAKKISVFCPSFISDIDSKLPKAHCTISGRLTHTYNFVIGTERKLSLTNNILLMSFPGPSPR